jgi:hypothetical protein
MATISKNRNLVSITLSTDKTYVFDVNTAELKGLRGQPLKQYPTHFLAEIRTYRWNCSNRDFVYRLATIFDNYKLSDLHNLVAALKTADSLSNMGIPVGGLDARCLEEISENVSLFARLYKECGNDVDDAWRMYRQEKERIEFVAKYGSKVYQTFSDNMNLLYSLNRENLSKEEAEAVAYIWTNGKWGEFGGGIGKIFDYIKLCRKIEKTPQHNNNFVREFVETQREYEARRKAYDTEAIHRNYARKANAFNFSFGGYTIVTPTCGEDIINEGKNMHHCVGGYVDNVVANSTYIVFVRPIDNPSACYITCQVDRNGRIGQYFLAYDKYISKEEDKAFKEAFAKHLAENW